MKNKIIHNIKANWLSGLTVGLVSIPLAVSLAIAAHASPVAGIITAFWSGLFASIFGGSNYNIIGPTGALAGLLLLNSTQHGAECLPILALMSGALIFIAYICKLERYLIFIPGSALHGFILGVALMIIFGQIQPALGLYDLPNHHGVLAKVSHLFYNFTMIHWPTFAVFICMLAGLLAFAFFTPRLPGTILLTPCGIGLGYLSAIGYLPWKIKTLGSQFPSITASLFQFPELHMNLNYILPAVSIATISILETMISARIADGATKTKHNKRKEMLGLSLANIASGFFGGIPATAALARTALNIRSGCTHKTSATISSLCIAVISLLFLQYFNYLPLAVIAAILVFVSLRMLQMEHFLRLFRLDKKNFVLSLVVAFVTLYEDATIGILLGAVIAMLLFMEKLSAGYHEIMTKDHEPQLQTKSLIPASSTLIYTIKGPLAYINTQAHITRLEKTPSHYTDVILDLHDVSFIDIDGAEALIDIIQMLCQKGINVYLVGLSLFAEHLLEHSSQIEILRKDNKIFSNINNALAAITEK